MNSLGRTPGAAPIRLRPLALMSAVVSALAVTVCVTLVGLPGSAASAASAAAASRATLSGTAVSGSAPPPGFTVALYATSSDSAAGGTPTVLARSVTGAGGAFTLRYRNDLPTGTVAYVLVRRGNTVRLATALGTAPLPARIVVNERTTVATGFALAQFVAGLSIAGPRPGTERGGDGREPRRYANGRLSTIVRPGPTGTRPQPCARSTRWRTCWPTARAARGLPASVPLAQPAAGSNPVGHSAAVADIARNPSHNVRRCLPSRARVPPLSACTGVRRIGPNAWTLALRFDGDGEDDERAREHGDRCTRRRVGRPTTTPTAATRWRPCAAASYCSSSRRPVATPGSPFTGGGLDGAGFGITLDLTATSGWATSVSRRWRADPPPHTSVSEFTPSRRAAVADPDDGAPHRGLHTRRHQLAAGDGLGPRAATSGSRTAPTTPSPATWAANPNAFTIVGRAGSRSRSTSRLTDAGRRS